MTDELKPCPFCGGKGLMNRDPCPDGGGVFLSIKCQRCRAKSGEKYHSNGNDCPQTYQEARDDWNTRTDATKDAEIERLRDILAWAYDTLEEVNPSNYDHDDVCRLNASSVEVILGIKSALDVTPDPAGGMPVEVK